MKKNKFYLLLLPLLLVGCSNKNNNNKDDEDKGNYLIKEDVSIDFLCLSDSKYNSSLVSIINGFKKIEPHVTVNICNPQGNGKYAMIAKTVFSGFFEGNYPDLVQSYPDDALVYLLADKLINLDPYLNNSTYGMSEDDKNDFIPSFLNEGKQYPQEGTYSVPFCKSTELMYYNADVLIGLDLSSVDNTINQGKKLDAEYLNNLTWEELFNKLCPAILAYNDSLSASDKILKEGKDSAVFTYDSDENFFITLANEYGDGYTSVVNGNPQTKFNNAAMKSLMADYRTYVANKYLQTNGSYGSYVSNLFNSRQCLFTVSSTAGLSYNCDSDNDPFTRGVCRIPHAEGKEYTAINQGPSLCILDHKDENRALASFLLWKHMTNVENSSSWAIKTGYMGIRQSSYKTDEYKNALEVQEGANYVDKARAENLKRIAEVSGNMFVTAVFEGSGSVRTNSGNLIKGCLSTNYDIETLFNYYDSLTTKAVYEID